MRGGPLGAKQARRLMRRPDVHVVHVYGSAVVEVVGVKRDALLARIEDFLAGNAPVHSDFDLGDFRDKDHRIVFMVDESC